VSARKERDRYRGRRRIPTPPRSRYAAVAATAVIGAGVVALTSAAVMPDMKVSDPNGLASFSGNMTISAARQSNINEASRSNTQRVTQIPSATGAMPVVWRLPMTTFTISTPFGDASALSKGVDLAAPEGTPFYTTHAGTVKLARWDGGYGYTVIIDVGNNTEIVYGHASKLLVHEGQQVGSGDLIALTGNTGYAFESGVHFEVRVNGSVVNPIEYLSNQGVSLTDKTDPETVS
jgi:murein DD-endopeptidase MepM/ murein hydrolase activator NlpD